MIKFGRICCVILVILFLALPRDVGPHAQASTASRLQTTTSISPDFDGDLIVGFGDFLLFAQAFGLFAQAFGGTDERFDLSGDGFVDFTDFIAFASQFGQAVEPPDSGPPLPDPTASVVLADTTDYEVIAPALTDDQGLAALQSTELGRSIEVRVTGKDADPVAGLIVRGSVLRGTLLVIVRDTAGVYTPAVVQGVPDSSALEPAEAGAKPASFVLSESGAIEISLKLYTIEESVEGELRIGDDITELADFSIADLADVSWSVDTYKGPASELARVMSSMVEGSSAIISVGLRDTVESTLEGLMAADRKLFEWMLAESDSIFANTVNALLARGYGEQVTVTLEDSTEAYLQVHRWSPSMAPHVWAFELILPAESGTQPVPLSTALPDPIASVVLADTTDYAVFKPVTTDETGLAILTSIELGRDIEVMVKGKDEEPISNLAVRATVLNGTVVVVVDDTTGAYPAAIVEGLPDSTSVTPGAVSKPATFVVTDRIRVFAGAESIVEVIAIEVTLLTLAESADNGLIVTSGLVEMADFVAGDFKDVSLSRDTYKAPLSQLARVMNSVTAGASSAISIGFVDTVGSTIPGLLASDRKLFDWTGVATSDSTMEVSSISDADTISSEVLRDLLTRGYGDQLTTTLANSTEAYLLVHQWSSAMAPYLFGLEVVLPATDGEQPPPPTPPELQLSVEHLAVDGTTTTRIDLRNLGTELLTWTVAEDVSWLDVIATTAVDTASTVDTTSISGQGEVILSVNTAAEDLDQAIYKGSIQVSSNGGDQIVLVTMSVRPSGSMDIFRFSFEGTLNGHSYYMSQDRTTWRDSKFKSEELGGYLAVVSSMDESELAESAARSVGGSVWVGLTDQVEQETWVGVVDEGSVFLDWGRNAPTNVDGEDFALFDARQDYTLNDALDSETHRFLVEFVEGTAPVEIPVTIRQFVAPSGRIIEAVKVPEGEFIMGSMDGSNDEDPVHTVFLDGFYIDRFEVTNAEYAEFLTARSNTEDGEGRSLIDLAGADIESRQGTEGFVVVSPLASDKPASEISWYGAFEYCAWVSGRLPFEAEWEKAARGPRARSYPWGESVPTLDLAVFNTTQAEDVGSLPNGSSFYGARDMAGNVWEWVQDWHDADYYAESPSSNPPGPRRGAAKVARGGAWNSDAGTLRATNRGGSAPENTSNTRGFRCVRDVPTTDP